MIDVLSSKEVQVEKRSNQETHADFSQFINLNFCPVVVNRYFLITGADLSSISGRTVYKPSCRLLICGTATGFTGFYAPLLKLQTVI